VGDGRGNGDICKHDALADEECACDEVFAKHREPRRRPFNEYVVEPMVYLSILHAL
jgi:hypothetical protein